MNPRPRSSTAVAALVLTVLAFAPFTPDIAGAVDVWNTMPVAPGPSSRYGHVAAFDPDSNRMIIFSGADRNQETWSLSLGETPGWRRLVTTSSPTGRGGAGMIYDPLRRRMLLFGGIDNSGYRNDVWALSLDGTPNWTQVVPSGSSPIGRADMVVVYDSIGDRMLIMGGFRLGSALSQPRNDVWALSLLGTPQWTQVLPLGTPPIGRQGHVGVFDPARNRMLIWGGFGINYDPLVWALELGSTPAWRSFDLPGAPSIRQFASAIRDPIGDRMLIFGGQILNAQPTNEVVSLELAGSMAWTVPPVNGIAPSPRRQHTAVYDGVLGRMIVFGGLNVDNGVYAYGSDPTMPEITGFSPQAGAVGDMVTVFGTGLLTTSQVQFNGTPSSFISVQYDQVLARVPSGATTGPISIVTDQGTLTTGTSFTVGVPPRIDSVLPVEACVGEEVVIRGAGFAGASLVSLGGSTDTVFTVRGDWEIAVVVSASAGVGPVTVKTLFGTASSASPFRKRTHDECMPPQPSQPLARLWDPAGRPIVSGAGIQSEPIACTDGAGGAFVAWLDDRSGAGTDLYATHVDSDGNTLPGWMPGGDPICLDPSTPAFPQIVSDDQGGAIVAWIDRRTGVDRLYALRLNPDAPRHPAWTPNGVRVADDSLSVNRNADLASDGNGGAYFSWVDTRPGQIYVQRRDGEARIPAGWDAGGLALGYTEQPPHENHYEIPNLLSDGAGGVLVGVGSVGRECYYPEPCRDTRWAAVFRISPDGVLNPSFTAVDPYRGLSVQPLATASGDLIACQDGVYISRSTMSLSARHWLIWGPGDYCLLHAYVPDGALGGFAAWNCYGDVVISRYNADGLSPPRWRTGGVVLSDLPGQGRDIHAIPDEQEGVVASWLYSPNASDWELYGQHVGHDGGLPEGTEDGFLLVTAPGVRSSHSLIPSSGLSALLLWQDTRNDGGDVYAQRIAWGGPTPVAYSIASTDAQPGFVRIRWYAPTSSSEVVIERAQGTSEWRGVGRATPSGGFVTFEDRDVIAGMRYGYRLHPARMSEPVGEISVQVPGSSQLALIGPSSNPSVTPLTIGFSLASHEPARLDLFDIAGRRVAGQQVGHLGPGRHVHELGDPRLAAGLYLVRLEQGGIRKTGRVLVVQ